jgi:repressor of nif and glnA expression
VLLGTISAVTIDGLLRSQGVPVIAKFGGLVEMVEGRPVRFTQIIHYDATSIDPLEIFIKGSMTSVRRAASSGDGVIGASFREIPAAALPKVIAIRASIDRIGVGGILMIGVPGRSVLDVPVASGHVGVVVPAGLNSCAAVEESGISTENVAVAIPFDFNELESVG